VKSSPDMHSWLDRNGVFHPVTGSHTSWLHRQRLSVEDAYRQGYARVLYVGNTIYAELPQPLNHYQKQALINLASETGMAQVVWDTGEKERAIWLRQSEESLAQRIADALLEVSPKTLWKSMEKSYDVFAYFGVPEYAERTSRHGTEQIASKTLDLANDTVVHFTLSGNRKTGYFVQGSIAKWMRDIHQNKYAHHTLAYLPTIEAPMSGVEERRATMKAIETISQEAPILVGQYKNERFQGGELTAALKDMCERAARMSTYFAKMHMQQEAEMEPSDLMRSSGILTYKTKSSKAIPGDDVYEMSAGHYIGTVYNSLGGWSALPPLTTKQKSQRFPTKNEACLYLVKMFQLWDEERMRGAQR